MNRRTTAQALENSFGFDPRESTHHFLVHIPRASADPVDISEHFSWDADTGSSPATPGPRSEGLLRCRLQRRKWDLIAETVRAHFNQRLKAMGLRLGLWRKGTNLVRRELGKELVLLAWAIEDADPALTTVALANWGGLVPEERWWLYTQAAAATGHGINDRGRGWRKAVRFALTENPITGKAPVDAVVPEYFRKVAAKTSESLPVQLEFGRRTRKRQDDE